MGAWGGKGETRTSLLPGCLREQQQSDLMKPSVVAAPLNPSTRPLCRCTETSTHDSFSSGIVPQTLNLYAPNCLKPQALKPNQLCSATPAWIAS